MQRFAVNSSHLRSVGWEDNTLEVEFSKGQIYHYHDVPENLYVELVNASSPGKYLLANIDGKYRHERI